MNNKIKIDIVSDVVCPWCVVGYKHLQAAIDDLNLQDQVDIEWQPFQLNPDMPPEGEELRAHVARKYGSSKADSDRARANITEAGAKYGFSFDYFDGMKIVNTFDAHLLLEYAHQVGKQHQLKLRLFSAFFSERKDISQRDILLSEAQAVGISVEQAEAALADNDLRDKVKATIQEWQQLGVNSVPTVVFNRSSALTGAHPQTVFEEVLETLHKDKS